jgi:hypothetical protein
MLVYCCSEFGSGTAPENLIFQCFQNSLACRELPPIENDLGLRSRCRCFAGRSGLVFGPVSLKFPLLTVPILYLTVVSEESSRPYCLSRVGASILSWLSFDDCESS